MSLAGLQLLVSAVGQAAISPLGEIGSTLARSLVEGDEARNRALGVSRLEPIPAMVAWPRQVLHRALPVTPAGTTIKDAP